MLNAKTERWLHRTFDLGMIIKFFDGVVEIAGGIFLLFISPAQLTMFAEWLTHKELSEDPRDLIARTLLDIAASFDLSAQKFAIWYLLIHGIVKLFIVLNLLRQKLWAYPFSLVVFILFGVYQCYRLSYDYSLWLLALTILDFCIVALIWHEYMVLRSRHAG